MREIGVCFLRFIIDVGMLVLLMSALLVRSVKGEDPTKTILLLTDLQKADWLVGQSTEVQLENLLAQWSQTEQNKEASPKDVARLYKLLGDNSYNVRQAAFVELVLLGEANQETLLSLCQGEAELEKAEKAKQILEQWQENRNKKPILIRNIFSVWKASSQEQQLNYAKLLVSTILKFPAEVSIPKQLSEIDIPAEDRKLSQVKIRPHEELFPGIVTQLKSHNTPKANLMLRSFLFEDNNILVLATIQLIGTPNEDPAIAIDLIQLAEGKNKAVALKALSHLSNWQTNEKYREEITAMLKRLYASKDEEVALQAAICSCYSGDWSGFPMLLEATKSPDKKIAMKAIGQLVDSRYGRSRAEKVVPLLIPHLQTDDLELLERTIETLGNYKGTAKQILPFLHHKDKHIVWRTIMALNDMGATEAIEPLEELLGKTTDKTTLGYTMEALTRLKRLQQKK